MTNISETNAIGRGRVIVIDLEDWIKMCKYLGSKQTRDRKAHCEVAEFQSSERLASTVDSRDSVSSTETASAFVEKNKKTPGEKNEDLCEEKKSKRAEKLLRNGDGGQCRLRCSYNMAQRDCLSKDDASKWKNENTARGCRMITFETLSMPSEHEVGHSMSERSAASDDDASLTASAAPSDCQGQKSVSDQCHCELTAGSSRGPRGSPVEKAVCPNCYHDDAWQKTDTDSCATETSSASCSSSGSISSDTDLDESESTQVDDDDETSSVAAGHCEV